MTIWPGKPWCRTHHIWQNISEQTGQDHWSLTAIYCPQWGLFIWRGMVPLHSTHQHNKKAINGCSRVTIIGDINVDLLKSDVTSGRYSEALKTLCVENSIEQLIHHSTRIQPMNIADGWVVYTSDFKSVEKCGRLHLSNSDHMAVYITYQNSDNRSAEK